MRRVVARQGGVGHYFLNLVYQTLAQCLAGMPDLLVGHFVDTFETALVVVVRLEFLAEHLGVDLFPLGGRPRGIVDAVGDGAHIEFFRQVARPHRREDLLAHAAVQPAHAVDLLREIGGQEAHREFLGRILGMDLAQAHEGVPVDLHPLGIVRDIDTQQVFREGVVSSRNRGVRSEERRGAHHFQRFRIGKIVILDVFPQTFETAESGVAFVAVVHVGLDAERAQGADTAHTEQQFLFEAVLPVTAVELMGYLAVFGEIVFVVGVEQEEIGAAYLDLPDTGIDITAREGYADFQPVALGVMHRGSRNLRKILRFIVGNLVAVGRQALGEVTVTVQQADRRHVDFHIGGFLQVVAGQDTQTAGIDLQRRVDTVLHAEVGHAGTLAGSLFIHIGLELLVHGVHPDKERRILFQFAVLLERNLVEQQERIAAGLFPQLGINPAEQVDGRLIPAPPEILGQGVEGTEPLGQLAADEDTRPGRLTGRIPRRRMQVVVGNLGKDLA